MQLRAVVRGGWALVLVLVGTVAVSFYAVAAQETAGATAVPDAAQALFPIVPWPNNLIPGTGEFCLDAATVIVTDPVSAASAEILAGTLRPSTGFELPVSQAGSALAESRCIVLQVTSSLQRLGEEGYSLSVTPKRVEIRAGAAAGILYGCQTLLQLLPPQVFSHSKTDGSTWRIACVSMEDQPRFPWRGLMLDPARFFLSPEFIKKYVDLLALHKMNRLHLHLTDSEAWTLEIKAYPELTNMDKWPLKLPERTRGIYTQDEIRELVRYADSRNVTLVPEIEFPAHSCIAMAAYPELMCPNNPLRTGAQAWGPKSYEWAEYCPASEKTYQFIDTVLGEVIALFSSPEIHVGGDEYFGLAWKGCPNCQERIQQADIKNGDTEELRGLFAKCTGDNSKYLLYRHMMRRVCAMVVAKGRRPMLWDDLSWRGGFPPNAVINQWHYQGGMDYMEFVPTPESPAVEAALAGHDVVVSPFSHLYFDLGDPRNTALVYGLEPAPEGLSPGQARHILGPHAPAWNQPETRADEMIFPRLIALAEIGWTDKDRRDWDGFVVRSKTHYERLTASGLRFPKDWAVGGNGTLLGSWTPGKLTSSSLELEWEASANIKDAGPYEVIMLYQKGEHGIAIDWVALVEDGKEIARDTHHGWSGYGKDNIVYTLELPVRKPQSVYTIKAGIDCHLGTDSTGDVLIRKQN